MEAGTLLFTGFFVPFIDSFCQPNDRLLVLTFVAAGKIATYHKLN